MDEERAMGKAEVGVTVLPAGWAPGKNAQRGEAGSESRKMSGNLPDGHTEEDVPGCDSASIQRHQGS